MLGHGQTRAGLGSGAGRRARDGLGDCGHQERGDGRERGTTVGPLITEKAVQKVDALVRQAVDEGATAAVGGAPSELGPNFYPPTVLTGVTPSMSLLGTEIFGPVAPVSRL